MAKAIHQVKRAAAPIKVRPPFVLSTVAASFLREHRALKAAERAYEAEAVREHGKRWLNPSHRDGLVSGRGTEARLRAVGAHRRSLEEMATKIIAGIRSKRRPAAPVDAVTRVAGSTWRRLRNCLTFQCVFKPTD